MPLDVTCPKCDFVFPVTEARHPVGVQCPSCDAEITAEFRRVPLPEPGESPYELLVTPGSPKDAPSPLSASKKALSLDDEEEETQTQGGSMVMVIVVALIALILTLGGLGATAYVLFTHLDTTETASSSSSSSGGGGTMPDPRGGSAQPGRGFLGGGGSGGSGGGGPLPGGGFPSGGFPGGAIPDIPTPPKKVDRFDLRPVTGPLPSFPETKFSDPSGTELISEFPGKADTLALGGAGRYLAMHFADAGKLVVVDLCEAKIVADKEADKGKVKLAAGLSRLVVWAPAARLFRVYDLPNLEKLYDAKCELFHGPQFIAMGNRTNGPLLASDFTGEVVLHDISKNDAPVIEGSRGRPGIHAGSEFGVRATPDGKVFATFDGFDKNHKAVLLSESGGKWSATKDTFAAYFPNAAGDLFFGNGGAMDASGRSANISSVGFGSDQWFVPATSGKFFLKIVSVPPSGGGKKTLTLTVHMNNRGDIRYPGLKPIQGIEAEGFLDGWSPAALDQHFILIPESKVLVFIPPSNDRVHFKRIEIR